MSKFSTRVKNLRSFVQLQFAIMKADKYHQIDGQRYYVMPYKNGKLMIFSKSSLKEWKREGCISKSSSVGSLERHCFYHTTYQNGNGVMDAADVLLREAIFYAWKSKLREEHK